MRFPSEDSSSQQASNDPLSTLQKTIDALAVTNYEQFIRKRKQDY